MPLCRWLKAEFSNFTRTAFTFSFFTSYQRTDSPCEVRSVGVQW
nr:MAG TPA: hypothetical protein [Caudoviricetes sp.]